jgi:hypothetical protein
MPPTKLELEVTVLIRQLGACDAAQLQEHLPDHQLRAIQKALAKAAQLNYLKRNPVGTYAFQQPKPPANMQAANDLLDQKRDAATIVRQALGSRSALELAWVNRIADEPRACMPGSPRFQCNK